MDTKELAKNVGEATRLLKAIANQNRLLILCMLVDGEKCVSDLESETGIPQPRLSQHLARLRADGLVRPRREAKEIRYSLASPEARETIGLLHKLFCDADGAN